MEEAYDKENSGNIRPVGNRHKVGQFNAIAERKQWLESGVAGRPNPGAFANNVNKNITISSKGVISQRMKWVEDQIINKGPMVGANKCGNTHTSCRC